MTSWQMDTPPGLRREVKVDKFNSISIWVINFWRASGTVEIRPPTWPLVPVRMQEWIDEVCAVGARIESAAQGGRVLVDELARVHNTFEQIHPFLEGNGRTGRLVLNLILVRLGYPPVVILKRQRAAYLAAMRRADAGDLGALGELIARAMYDNLIRFIVPNVAGPVRMVPLAALVDTEFSLPALRQAAQ